MNFKMEKIFIIFMIILFMTMSAVYSEGNSTNTNVCYFNASSPVDGNGSMESPYKYISDDRIVYGTTFYFADGVYELNETCSVYSSTRNRTSFIGQSTDNTIIRFVGQDKPAIIIKKNSYAIFANLTFDNGNIANSATLEARNVVFKNSAGYEHLQENYFYDDSEYNKSRGGCIINDNTNDLPTTMILDNCTFTNNTATYGGAISLRITNAKIRNTRFYASRSDIYGGAITSTLSNLTIENCQFFQSYAPTDSGGAIYSINNNLKIINSTFRYGIAEFGGAICSLNSTLSVSGSTFEDNLAFYEGGTIYVMYGNATIDRCIFSHCEAIAGGAMFIDNATACGLSNSVFSNNTKSTIFISSSNLTHSNLTLHENQTIHVQSQYDYDIAYNASVPLIVYNPTGKKLPKRYDSRDYGYITPVHDQETGGNCWAFAGIATLEANLKKATGLTYDFSEENLKNLMSIYSRYGQNLEENMGGYMTTAIAYFANWLGPVLDKYDRYDDNTALSYNFTPTIHIQNIIMIPQRANHRDNSKIKQAVMMYGAVAVGVEWDMDENHAVTIVGWDDNYIPSDDDFDFDEYGTPGAWIIKNSWGDDWNDGGFEYMPYSKDLVTELECFCGYAFVFSDKTGYNRNYQYDIPGCTDYLLTKAKTLYYKNTFQSKGKDRLSAFSTYFAGDTDYVVKLYINGKLKLAQKGTGHLGYWTISFKKEFIINKGDSFTIEIKVNSDRIPISENVSSAKLTYSPKTSWFSYDGKKWKDLFYYKGEIGDHIYYSQVACIKAFTRPVNLIKTEITVDSFSKLTVNTKTTITAHINTSALNGSLLRFDINGKYYYATIKNQTAKLKVSFSKAGTYAVSVSVKNNLYTSNTAKFKFKIPQTIKVESWKRGYNSPYDFKATLLDNSGKILKNTKAEITVNGKKHTVRTDNKGIAKLRLKLKVGSYKVSILNTVTTEKITDTLKIQKRITNNKNMVKYFTNTKTFDVKVYGDDGKLAGKNQIVTFKIKNKIFKARTNSKGAASLKINLKPGKYIITAAYKGYSTKNTITVKSIVITRNVLKKAERPVKFNVKILNAKGKAHPAQLVKVTLKGRNYYAKTNRYGIASFTINEKLKIGKYPIRTVSKGLVNTNTLTVIR